MSTILMIFFGTIAILFALITVAAFLSYAKKGSEGFQSLFFYNPGFGIAAFCAVAMIVQLLGVFAVYLMEDFQRELEIQSNTPTLIEFLYGVDGYGIHIASGYLCIGLIFLVLGLYLQRKYPDRVS